LILVRGGFLHNADVQLNADIIIVDEASMLDLPLFHSLLNAIKPSSHLVLIGDAYQLPSVGVGQVLKDILSWDGIKRISLNKLFRQRDEATIVHIAHSIKEGFVPAFTNKKGNDAFFLRCNTPEEGLSTILDLVRRRLKAGFNLDFNDIQVLSPMYKGKVGIEALNNALQNELNPIKDRDSILPLGFLRLNDRVIQLRNNYDKGVFNGDMGRIELIDDEEMVKIRFDDRLVDYSLDELDEVMLAYACSIHKAQGSEYPCMIMPLFTEHFLMLKRNLLYTALTRARRLAILVGQPYALELAVKNNTEDLRYSLLAQRLEGLLT